MVQPFQKKAIGATLVRRFQYFTASGFFYPTQAMLDAGGVLELDIRGGGGGFGLGAGDIPGYAGGSSKHLAPYQLTNLAPITVTIGAGGAAANPDGSDGGSTTFGTLTVPGAKGGSYSNAVPGAGSGSEGQCGLINLHAANSNWSGSIAVRSSAPTTTANSGAGGAFFGSQNGQAGAVLVYWWEKQQ